MVCGLNEYMRLINFPHGMCLKVKVINHHFLYDSLLICLTPCSLHVYCKQKLNRYNVVHVSKMNS